LRSVVLHELIEDRAVVGDVLLGIGAQSVQQAVHWRKPVPWSYSSAPRAMTTPHSPVRPKA